LELELEAYWQEPGSKFMCGGFPREKTGTPIGHHRNAGPKISRLKIFHSISAFAMILSHFTRRSLPTPTNYKYGQQYDRKCGQAAGTASANCCQNMWTSSHKKGLK